MIECIRHFLIEGRVQGVGFRWALKAEARRLGLGGWVRNRMDGRVEGVAGGSAERVDDLLFWARRGPPAARVDRLVLDDWTEAGIVMPDGFEERPTV